MRTFYYFIDSCYWPRIPNLIVSYEFFELFCYYVAWGKNICRYGGWRNKVGQSKYLDNIELLDLGVIKGVKFLSKVSDTLRKKVSLNLNGIRLARLAGLEIYGSRHTHTKITCAGWAYLSNCN